MSNLTAPTSSWENRTRGPAVALTYLVEIDGTLGETENRAEATHIEVMLPNGTVGVDAIGNYPEGHTQEIAMRDEVLALRVGLYRDPLNGAAGVFNRNSAATSVLEQMLMTLASVEFTRATIGAYTEDT